MTCGAVNLALQCEMNNRTKDRNGNFKVKALSVRNDFDNLMKTSSDHLHCLLTESISLIVLILEQ